MAPVRRITDFLTELQQLEKASVAAQGPLILEAFVRHTRFDGGALYLREGRTSGMRLAAKSPSCHSRRPRAWMIWASRMLSLP